MPDAAQTAASPITELKVSGHLMTLDPGVFCVFSAPGTAAADAATGLPGVRISPAPAPGAFKGVVTLSGFTGDGWLGGVGDATLVRVSGGPAQVLVTVYQVQDSGQDAPKLQVLRLTEPATAAEPPAKAQPKAEPQRTPAGAAAQAEVGAHISGQGDVGGQLGAWMGERGSKRSIEGFLVHPASDVPVSDVEYQAVLGPGWLSPWSEGGQFCGSRGMSLPILGLRVRLRGASAATHRVRLSATFIDGTAIGPVEGGEACEAPSLAALEAFQLTLERLGVAAATSRETAGKATAASRKSSPGAAPRAPAQVVKPKRGKSSSAAAPEPEVPAPRGRTRTPVGGKAPASSAKSPSPPAPRPARGRRR